MRSKLFYSVLAAALWLCASLPAMAQEFSPEYANRDQNVTSADYTLKTSVMRGLAANPAIMSARAQLLGSEYGEKSALGAFGPAATINYGYLHRDPSQQSQGVTTSEPDLWGMNLNLNQPIFTGFRLLSTYEQAQLTKDQNQAKLDNVELQLILTIQTAFFSLLRGRMDVKSAEDEVARLESQLKVAQAFFEVGLKPRLDVLEAEVNLADAQQNLVMSKNYVDTQTANLNTLLNLPLENPTNYTGELTYLPFSRKLPECLEEAYKKRPDIYIGKKSVEIAGKSADITFSTFYPQVEANFDWYKQGDDPGLSGSKYMDSSLEDYWTVGASVSWKFFEWGSNYNAYKQDMETVSQMASELDSTTLNAGYEVKQNLLDIGAAADRIRVARKAVEAAKESFRMAQARYQAQVGTSTDVLDNQARLTRSEAQLNRALSDYQTSIANLYVSMGEKNPGLVTQ